MRPSEGRIRLWPLAMIASVLLLAGLSVTPSVKLNPVPPSDFVSGVRSKPALVQGYWETAVRVIQWKYSRASPLPEQVPADFRLAGAANLEDRAACAAYWAKLREEWLRPENWHTTYYVDLGWPLRAARNLSNGIMRFIDQT
jgi:hypothetical protein